MTKIDFKNLDRMVGEEPAKSVKLPADVTKVAENAVASYLLREKGYTTTQIARALRIKKHMVAGGMTHVRRAKQIDSVLASIGKTLADIK